MVCYRSNLPSVNGNFLILRLLHLVAACPIATGRLCEAFGIGARRSVRIAAQPVD